MTTYRMIQAFTFIAALIGISSAPANAQNFDRLTAAPLGNFGVIFSEDVSSTTTEDVIARWRSLLDDCSTCSTGVTIGGEVVGINWDSTMFSNTVSGGFVVITREQYNEYQRMKNYCDNNYCGD